MLTFTIVANKEITMDMALETDEIAILLDMIKRYKKDISAYELYSLDAIYNKIKALYFLDKQPDEQGLKQIQSILFPSNEISSNNAHIVSIESLSFSKRTFHCLDRANIKTLGELLCLSEEELLRIRNLGVQSLNEITETLSNYDLALPRFKNTK